MDRGLSNGRRAGRRLAVSGLRISLLTVLLLGCGFGCSGFLPAAAGRAEVELVGPGEPPPRLIGYRLNVGDEVWVRVWEQPRVGSVGEEPGRAPVYRLAPYDVVTVDVWSLPEPEQQEGAYRVRAGDLLGVNVWGVSELDRQVRVRPDGHFSYDLVGEVEAGGRTVPEVREDLQQRLSVYLKDPQVSLTVEELVAPRPLTRLDMRDCLVRPDGGCTVPLAGEVQAAGRTVEEVRREIERRLAEVVERPRVSVELRTMAPERTVKLDEKVVIRPDGMMDLLWVGQVPAAGRTVGQLANGLQADLQGAMLNPAVSVVVTQLAAKRVMVLGAVRNQGIFGFQSVLRLSEALAIAGGAVEDANLSQVRIIRAMPSGRDVRRVRVDRLLAKGDLSQDLLIEDGDVIFVPNKWIADVNYYVLRVLPFVDMVYTMALTRDIVEAW